MIPTNSDSDFKVEFAQASQSKDRPNISIAQALRSLGALAVIISLSQFTLQGWSSGNDISRYLSLLSQTGLLVLSGFLLSKIVKELKGARVFYILALGSVIANFTILSAMLYSFMPLDLTVVDYPAMMKWEVINPLTFTPIAIASILALAALSYFAFAILARPVAKRLTISLFLMSLLILMPVRLPLLAAVLASIALFFAVRQIKTLSKVAGVFPTFETKVAFGILLLPSVIIMARALLLYPIEPFVNALFSAVAYFGLRYWRTQTGKHLAVEIVSHVAAISTALFLFVALEAKFDIYALAASAILLIGFCFDQSVQSNSVRTRQLISVSLSFVFMPIMLLIGMADNQVDTSLVTLVINGAVVTFNAFLARQYQQKGASFLAGNLLFVITALFTAGHAVELILTGNWLILGVIGALLIFGGSLVDRFKSA